MEDYKLLIDLHKQGYRQGPGGDAQFCPPIEQLVFRLQPPEEVDLPEIWAEPLAMVVQVLTGYATVDEVYKNLPDIELLPMTKSC